MARIRPDTGVLLPSLPTPPPERIIAEGRRCQDWIATFLRYTDHAEAPPEFLYWSALSTIAAVAQRKVSMFTEYFSVMSNMYVVLVGKPGSGKTVAIDQGRKLLAKVPGIYLTSDAPSVVGLMRDFADIPNKDHQSLNAFIYELSSLYENAQETMSGFLTVIYDGKDDYKKRTRIGGMAAEHIPFPWFNLLAGTTPVWLGERITKAELSGGLVARTLYIFSDEIVLKPRLGHDPAYAKMREDLVHDLAYISTLRGEFTYETPEARTWYETWRQDKSRFPRMTDARTEGYFVRKPAHLLKVAMALSLSHKDELALSLEDLQLARKMLEQIEPGMKSAFTSVGGNPHANDLERIHAAIREAGPEGLSYSDIVAGNLYAVELRMIDGILNALVAMHAVKRTVNVQRGESSYVSAE
jgi:hypothetical protein